MEKHLLKASLILLIFMSVEMTYAQVGINDTSSPPDPSAMLDVKSTHKGMLIPRMTEMEKININNPSHSLLIYQTDGEAGFYYNSGTPLSPVWLPLASSSTDGPIRIPIDTLPFVINTPGSYFITESLNGAPGMDGITITTSNVTIDLNGNCLLGDGNGTNAAILSSGVVNQLNIYNGFISNWGGHGINLTSSTSSSLNHLQIDDCGYSGINSGSKSIIAHCITTNNGLDGISSNNSSTITNCTALDNGSDGIDVANYCSIINSHAKSNQGNGFETGSTCMIKHCLAYDNDDNGVYLGSGSSISGSVSSNNTLSGYEILTGGKADNNQSRSNGENGYVISNDVAISNCSADNNTLSGFLCDSSDARIDNNQSTDNGQHGFSVTGTGNVILRNSSSGNVSLPYNIVAGNLSGTVLTSATFNTNNNPYANVEF